MGLFSGWANRYDRPGKGVSKDAPQKKAFFVFWEIYARKFWKLCVANLLFVLVNIPLVTRGMADAGLAYITRNFSREKHAFVASDFFETIKKNWKQALPVGIINLLLTALIVYTVSVYYFNATESTLSFIGLALTGSVYVIFTVMKYYIPFLMITFKYNLRAIYKNAMFLVGVGWKANLVVSGVLLLCYALIVMLVLLLDSIGIGLAILLYFFVFPAFRSFLIQFAIFPTIKRVIIDPYYEAHPEEDKDKRRDLNLEVEEETASEDEVIFVDRGETKPEETKEEKKPARTIPRQYTEAEMRRLENKRRQSDDDDDTI